MSSNQDKSKGRKRKNRRSNKNKNKNNNGNNGAKSTPNRVLTLAQYEKRLNKQKKAKDIANKKQIDEEKERQKKKEEEMRKQKEIEEKEKQRKQKELKEKELKKKQLISKSRTIALPKRIKNNGIRRLMCDYKDFLKNKNEFPFINAKPLDNNIFEWHCNLFGHCGIYQGFIIHLKLVFAKDYPLTPPKVTILTPIVHSNIINGNSICLDMFELQYNSKYKGWTPAYSVSSILMQLQSFLFESNKIQQDYGTNLNTLEAQIRDRRFWDYNWSSVNKQGITVRRKTAQQVYDEFKEEFDTSLATMKSIKCKQCGHCYESPMPYVDNNNLKITLAKDFDELFERCQNEGWAIDEQTNNNNTNENNTCNINNQHNDNNTDCKNDNEFEFWEEIYKDTEDCILSFLNFVDLKRLMCVSKKFNKMAKQSKIIQRNGIECWFHRSYSIPLQLSNTNNPYARKQLCLGFGITPHYYGSNSATRLRDQIFSRRNKKDIINIKCGIGRYELISNIDVTFDLLSSNAFEQFNIRRTIFKDRTFTHWIPLYINKGHGKLTMSLLKTYVLRIFGKKDDANYHPYLALYCVANMMKSVIVSLMKTSENKEGIISLHYSINVLEAYLRLHHLLLAIYYHNKQELKSMIQDQINMFFESFDDNIVYNSSIDYSNDDYNKCRNKSRIPDYGVFLMFLTLWEQDNKFSNNSAFDWNNGVGVSLLDEIFTRQIKWLLEKYPRFANVENENKYYNQSRKIDLNNERTSKMFETGHISHRLFMFQYFFLTKVCQIFSITSNNNNNNNNNVNSARVSPTDKYLEYNNNNGLLNDSKLANKLQLFVKNSHKCRSYDEFFNIIELPCPSDHRLAMWFIKCLKQSETRGYHKKTEANGYERQSRSINTYSSSNYSSNYNNNYSNNYNRGNYSRNNSRPSSGTRDMNRSWRR